VSSKETLVHDHDAAHESAPGHVGTDVPGRDGVLSSIATALGDDSRQTILSPERSYHVNGTLDAFERRELLKDRLIDYRAQVVECDVSELARIVQSLLTAHASASVAVPGDAPVEWLAEVTAEVHRDEPTLSVAQLDGIDSTVSGCAVAIAQTGTIILDSGVHQGRRALSLIPDHLIVVIYDEQIVELVPEGVARLAPDSTQTWISGPSATSDIELERIEGVHGPRTLDVILVTTRS
jgi:L-lactate dehydrogenase complex protein LldG